MLDWHRPRALAENPPTPQLDKEIFLTRNMGLVGQSLLGIKSFPREYF